MATGSQSATSEGLPNPHLPVPQLESLKSRANQIIDSIRLLQWTIDNGHPAMMPAWPDILSKYSTLLSQTHNFSTALSQPFPAAAAASSSRKAQQTFYETIALHPKTGMTDAQLDSDVAPLLRNQQTMDVLRMENETVRRLAEHMNTRGSLGVLGMVQPPAPSGGNFGGPARKPEYEDVLKECTEIREAHDRRVDRAVRAVTMLREKFDWKQRVEVEVEEPEELDWDPRVAHGPMAEPRAAEDSEDDDDGDEEMGTPTEGGNEPNSDEEDEDDVQGALVNVDVAASSPPAPVTPGQPGVPIEIDDD